RRVVPDGVRRRIDLAEVRAPQADKGRAGIADRAAEGIEEALAAVAGLMRPRAVYRMLAVAGVERDRLVLAGGTQLHIPAIGEHWGPVEAVMPALVTIGDGVDALTRERKTAGDPA